MNSRGPFFGTVSTDVMYWPSYVDVLATILMIFILQSFLQTTLNVDDLEVARLRQAQERLRLAMEVEFRAETREGKIALDISPNLLQIRFSEEILFDSGSFELWPNGARVLRRCAQVLSRPGIAPFEQIQVEGHTDSRRLARLQYPRNNWELSTARALTVVNTLIGNGIEPAKLSANGYAEFRPIAGSGRASDQGLNRRIELRIVFSTPKQKR